MEGRSSVRSIAVMNSIHEILLHSPMARLFAIIALGYLVGEIRFPGGFRLGVAGVLFVGLACGAMSPDFQLPAEVQSLGLVLFVYCVGLQAAPGFLKSFKRDGLRLNLALVLALAVTAGATFALMRITGRGSAPLTGLFTGALTNTPALGAATETLARRSGGADAVDLVVVGYGVAYPVSIVLVLLLVQWLAARAPAGDRKAANLLALPPAMTIAVETPNPNCGAWRVHEIAEKCGVLVTRVRTAGGTSELAAEATELPPGSLVLAVGTPTHLDAAAAALGHKSEVRLEDETRGFERHRYFVSNAEAVERPLRALQLSRLGAVVSRLRRGDVDLPVTGDTVLHFGDRVRVISYRDTEPAVRKFFGNSLTVLTETGYFSFALGIVLGLLLGQIPIPLPGMAEPIRLGIAGGPLVAALLLGSLGRTGPCIWSIPNEANMTLRHLGTLLFLAGVGVKAGRGLLAVLQSDGLALVALAVAITVVAHATFLAALRLLGERKLPAMLGAIAGFQTQPAVLAFAASKTDAGPMNTAYAAVYPLAIVLKIILAQLLVAA